MISRIKAELLSNEDAKKLDADANNAVDLASKNGVKEDIEAIYGVRLTNRKGDERLVSVRFKSIMDLGRRAELLAQKRVVDGCFKQEVCLRMFDGERNKVHEIIRDVYRHNTFFEQLRKDIGWLEDKNLQKIYAKAYNVICTAEEKKAKLEEKRKEKEAKAEAKARAKEVTHSPLSRVCRAFLNGRDK